VFRQRRLAAVLEPALAMQRESATVVSHRPGRTLDEVAVAIAEARNIAGVFMRLGRQAHPTFAWRCAKVGVALRDALDRQFPELLRAFRSGGSKCETTRRDYREPTLDKQGDCAPAARP